MATQSHINQVDIALLYQDYTPFSYLELAQRLQLICGDHSPVSLGHCQDGIFGVVKIGPICALISQNQTPLDAEGFSAAIESPFNARSCPQARSLVKEHRKNVFITVGNSDILTNQIRNNDAARELEAALGEELFPVTAPTRSEFSDWLFIARIVCRQVMEIARPTLVHWCQSNQLFMPEDIDSLADPRGMTLYIHPFLFSNGSDARGRQMLGYHAFGSEQLTGHHVVVEETSLDFPEVRHAVDGFIYGLIAENTPPMDGQILDMKSGAKLKVNRMGPDQRYPGHYLSIDVLAVGNGLAEEAQRVKKTRAMRDKIVGNIDTKTNDGEKPIYKTTMGQIAIGLCLIFALGLPRGILLCAAWFLWNRYRNAKNR